MNILLITVSAPPAQSSHATRILSFCKAFYESGNQTTVVTVDRSTEEFRKSGLAEDLFDVAKVQRVRSFGAANVFRSSLNRVDHDQPTQIRKVLIRIRSVLRTWARRNAFPDTYMEWIPFAFRKSRDLTRSEAFDCIVSSGAPFSAHVVSALVARSSSLPLILDYGDPWVYEPGRPRKGLRLWVERFLEKSILAKAALVTVTTEETADFYRKTFGLDHEKVVVVPMGFYDKEFPTVPHSSMRSLMRLVYAGRINPEYRDASVIFDYLEQKRATPCPVEFHFFSPEAENLRARVVGISQDSDCALIQVYDAVPHDRFLWEISNSSANIVLGNSSTMQIPGKIAQYIGAARPIIYVPMVDEEHDPSLNLLRKVFHSGLYVVRTSSDLADAIEAIFASREGPILNKDARAALEWSQTSQYLVDRLALIVGRNNSTIKLL